MTGSQRVILLACGSFNPPTNMHLRMFEIARDFLHRTTNYNVVAGLMSPVHDKYGKEGLASANDRIQMLRLALNSSSWVHVSEWETVQDDWTPTRESIQYHQNLIQTTLHKLGRSSASSRHHARELVDSVVNGNVDPTVKRQRLDSSQSWLNHLTTSTDPVCVKLLCGADLLESFAKPGLWKDEDIEALVGKYGIVVITREGSNPYKFIYESDVLTKHQKNIHIVTEWITNEVSSTKVRRALRRGESVKYLVQDSVIDYIYKNALFNTHNKVSAGELPLFINVHIYPGKVKDLSNIVDLYLDTWQITPAIIQYCDHWKGRLWDFCAFGYLLGCVHIIRHCPTIEYRYRTLMGAGMSCDDVRSTKTNVIDLATSSATRVSLDP